jgi:hypothetical protein
LFYAFSLRGKYKRKINMIKFFLILAYEQAHFFLGSITVAAVCFGPGG